MKVTREDVLRVAELAHLELTEAEIESFGRHLDSILTYADKLNELDTSAVEPMAQVLPSGSGAEPGGRNVGTCSFNPDARDVVAPCDCGRRRSGRRRPTPVAHFRVPKVIER